MFHASDLSGLRHCGCNANCCPDCLQDCTVEHVGDLLVHSACVCGAARYCMDLTLTQSTEDGKTDCIPFCANVTDVHRLVVQLSVLSRQTCYRMHLCKQTDQVHFNQQHSFNTAACSTVDCHAAWQCSPVHHTWSHQGHLQQPQSGSRGPP